MPPRAEDEYARRKRKAREEQEDEAKHSYTLPDFDLFLHLPALDPTKGKPSPEEITRAKRFAHRDLLVLKNNGLAETEWARRQSLVNQAADVLMDYDWAQIRRKYLR